VHSTLDNHIIVYSQLGL